MIYDERTLARCIGIQEQLSVVSVLTSFFPSWGVGKIKNVF